MPKFSFTAYEMMTLIYFRTYGRALQNFHFNL